MPVEGPSIEPDHEHGFELVCGVFVVLLEDLYESRVVESDEFVQLGHLAGDAVHVFLDTCKRRVPVSLAVG